MFSKTESAAPAAAPAWRPRGLTLDVCVALIAIAAALVARAVIGGGGRPLWLDEAWTGAIVAQTDVAHLMQQIWLDPNAPLYFGLMYGWTKLFGLSDVALRFPSLVFGVAAPLLIAFARVPGLSRDTRLAWSALLALWVPGIWFAQEARGYALLLLLCSAQSVLFLRLMAAPRLEAACWWAACSSLVVLTHYHAGFLTLCEGLAFLGLWRLRAVKTWPAAFAFFPAFAWIAWHAPRLLAFTQPGIAWYETLQPHDLLYILQFLAGAPSVPLAFALAAAFGYVASRGRGADVRAGDAIPFGCRVLILCALAAAGIVIGISFLRPMFTSRYLMPVMPAVTLALALAVQVLARRWARTYALVLLVCLGGAALAVRETAARPHAYSFEQASRDLAANGARNLVFALDNPATPVLHDSTLRALGGFFFVQDGHPVAVTPVRLHDGEDGSTALLAQAQAPRTGILWVYDLKMHDTVAGRNPPRISQVDARWRCKDYGRDNIGIVACTRRTD